MASTPRQGRSKTSDISNPDLPMSAPGTSFGVDHSFTLQAVMEMQKSIGALEVSVNNLSTQIGTQKQSMDDLKKSVRTIEKVMYAAGLVLIIALAVGGWMLNTAKDFAMLYFKTNIEAQAKNASESNKESVTPPAGKPKHQ